MSADERFVQTVRLPVPAEEALRWHQRPGAFARLVPPWERVRLLAGGEAGGEEGTTPGTRLVLEARLGPLRVAWVAEHEALEQGIGFRDVQRAGPFAAWSHEHRFVPRPGGSELEDRIRYRLPFGAPGRAAAAAVRRRLARMFSYRHRVVAADLARHAPYRGRRSMRVAISGASGLVGSALCAFLTTGGHSVLRLVRRPARGPDEVRWDPEAGTIDAAALEGIDALVHLAGENLAAKRWTAAQKRRLRESRVVGTGLVARALAGLRARPSTLVHASAVGYYGDRGDQRLAESSGQGRGFLAELCRDWEAAAEPARAAGIRVVAARFGVVLSPRGGALAKMLTPFKLGVGGKIGSGEQFMAWIALDDAIAALHHALQTPTLSGAVNVVAPRAVTNAELTKTLGRVLHRPTIATVPAFAAKAAFGELADEALLASQRAVPQALEREGFTWDYPELEPALRHVLGRDRARNPER